MQLTPLKRQQERGGGGYHDGSRGLMSPTSRPPTPPLSRIPSTFALDGFCDAVSRLNGCAYLACACWCGTQLAFFSFTERRVMLGGLRPG